jgi:hypothetical protein
MLHDSSDEDEGGGGHIGQKSVKNLIITTE